MTNIHTVKDCLWNMPHPPPITLDSDYFLDYVWCFSDLQTYFLCVSFIWKLGSNTILSWCCFNGKHLTACVWKKTICIGCNFFRRQYPMKWTHCCWRLILYKLMKIDVYKLTFSALTAKLPLRDFRWARPQLRQSSFFQIVYKHKIVNCPHT